MSPTMSTSTQSRAGHRMHWKSVLIGVVVAVVGVPLAAVAAPVGTQFNDLPPNSEQSHQATEVADAGLMTGFPDGGFHPFTKTSRLLMAQTLHRGLPRMSLTRDIDDFPAVDDGNERASISVLVDGFFRGSQAVMVTLNMEVSSTGLTQDCATHLEVQSQPYSFEAGTWDFTLSPTGATHRSVSATFMAAQASATGYTYVLFGYTDCPHPVHVDNGVMTAQTFAFNGNGNAYEQH
jgi:hypothetical protein